MSVTASNTLKKYSAFLSEEVKTAKKILNKWNNDRMDRCVKETCDFLLTSSTAPDILITEYFNAIGRNKPIAYQNNITRLLCDHMSKVLRLCGRSHPELMQYIKTDMI